MKVLFSVGYMLLALTVYAQLDYNGDIARLSFLEIQSKDDTWVVMIRGPGCTICKRFKYLWKEVAQKLKFVEGIKIGKLGKQWYDDFASRFDTSKLRNPEIFIFEKGKYEIYNGNFTSQAIVNFAKKHKGKLVKAIPEPRMLHEWIWSEAKKNTAPFFWLIDSIGLGSLPTSFQTVIVFLILFLPLLLVPVLWWTNEEKEGDYLDIQASPSRSERAGGESSESPPTFGNIKGEDEGAESPESVDTDFKFHTEIETTLHSPERRMPTYSKGVPTGSSSQLKQ